jgi:CDGSH-type Zn-finger protein
MEKKYYSIKKFGDGKSPHLLENKDDVSDILALCSCGDSDDPERKCDGSHIKKIKADSESESAGCCGGGCRS